MQLVEVVPNYIKTKENKLKIFDYKKSTVQMLGRWQIWYEGDIQHCLKSIREDRTSINNGSVMYKALMLVWEMMITFDFEKINNDIVLKLFERGYIIGEDFEVMLS